MIDHYVEQIVIIISSLVGISILFPILFWPILLVITLIIVNRRRKIRRLWLICVSLVIIQLGWVFGLFSLFYQALSTIYVSPL